MVNDTLSYFSQLADEILSYISKHEVAVKTSAVAGTTAVVGTTLANTVLGVFGFSSGGVVAGSIAATIQAAIGNVVAGSWFSALQAIGAVGGFAVAGPVGAGLAAVAGAAYAALRFWE